jgi:predicted DCC family thiol-disulfide oxidoreductase YuxK
MGQSKEPAYVLFDGDCGICTYTAEWAKRTDRRNRFVVRPYQEFSDEELERFGVTREECSKRVQVISPGGRVFSGALAVNYVLFYRFPWSVLVVLAYLVPVLLLAEVITYGIIARNRHHISSWFGLTSCAMKSE